MNDTGNGDFEFERRFVVREMPTGLVDTTPTLIVQSYFVADEGYALRVRVQAPTHRAAVDLGTDELTLLAYHIEDVDFCAVTVKGPMVEGTRYEAERELDPQIGVQLVSRGGHRVAKLRHAVWLGEDGWVIDEFCGGNAPLIIAEVERGSPVVDLAIPSFCFSEVTADPRLTNDALAGNPFGRWAADYFDELEDMGPVFLSGLGENRPMVD